MVSDATRPASIIRWVGDSTPDEEPRLFDLYLTCYPFFAITFFFEAMDRMGCTFDILFITSFVPVGTWCLKLALKDA